MPKKVLGKSLLFSLQYKSAKKPICVPRGFPKEMPKEIRKDGCYKSQNNDTKELQISQKRKINRRKKHCFPRHKKTDKNQNIFILAHILCHILIFDNFHDDNVKLSFHTHFTIFIHYPIMRKVNHILLPQAGREAENEGFWKEHKGAVKCPTCGNVHFKKRWYASEKDLLARLKTKKLEITDKKLCRACRMAKDGLFEGEIFIEGFSPQQKTELLNLVKNYGERATRRDPQDRILKIEKIPAHAGYRIITTENQLAGKLAKKIQRVFKTDKIEISHLPEPAKVERIHITFR